MKIENVRRKWVDVGAHLPIINSKGNEGMKFELYFYLDEYDDANQYSNHDELAYAMANSPHTPPEIVELLMFDRNDEIKECAIRTAHHLGLINPNDIKTVFDPPFLRKLTKIGYSKSSNDMEKLAIVVKRCRSEYHYASLINCCNISLFTVLQSLVCGQAGPWTMRLLYTWNTRYARCLDKDEWPYFINLARQYDALHKNLGNPNLYNVGDILKQLNMDD